MAVIVIVMIIVITFIVVVVAVTAGTVYGQIRLTNSGDYAE